MYSRIHIIVRGKTPGGPARPDALPTYPVHIDVSNIVCIGVCVCVCVCLLQLVILPFDHVPTFVQVHCIGAQTRPPTRMTKTDVPLRTLVEATEHSARGIALV